MKPKFDIGKEIAQRSTIEKLKIIVANLGRLQPKYQSVAVEFKEIMLSGERFTPNQMNYIEGIYEKLMAANGFDACTVKHDFQKKTLRY